VSTDPPGPTPTRGGRGADYSDLQMIQRMAGSGRHELLLGRGTYEIFAVCWPYSDGSLADQLSRTRKHVAARTLRQLDRDHATLISGNVPEHGTPPKSENGPQIQVHGSPGPICTLLGHYLVEELRVWILPWYAAPASASSATARSRSGPKLTGGTVPKTEVTIDTYERAGEIGPGSPECDEPEPKRNWVELGDPVRGPGGSHKW